MGVTVPDPTPGGAIVAVNGNVAYKFNGVFLPADLRQRGHPICDLSAVRPPISEPVTSAAA